MLDKKIGVLSLEERHLTRLINYMRDIDVNRFAKSAKKEHEQIERKLSLAFDHYHDGKILRDGFKPKVKIFLVHVTIQDGGHEHRDECLMKAKNAASAARIARRLIEKGGYDKESGTGYFDYGDDSTACEINHIEEITQDEAEVLQKFSICYFMN